MTNSDANLSCPSSTVRQVYTGFRALDHIAPLNVGDLSILGSRPGHGSVAFALKVCLNIVRQAVPVLWFGLAHSTDDLMRPLLAAKGRDPRSMAASAIELAELPLSVVDSTNSNLSRIGELTKDWRAQHEQPRSVVVVDDLGGVPYEGGLSRSTRPFTEVEGAHQRAVAAGLKQLAKDLGVAVLLLARHQASDRQPVLGDLPYDVAAHADVVAFLHREAQQCRVIVAQQKNGPVGAIDIALELHPRFRFVADDEARVGGGLHGV